MKSLRTEQFLLYAHQRFPGMTSSCFTSEAGNILDDRSTYDRLVDIIPRGDGGTIIDLACGDGYLCQRLVALRPKDAKIIGIDFSPDEIQAAEERLSGSHVRLLCARAQELPIASQSADYVLCHMALMLMTELDRVVDELARVLKHHGVFSCIIPTGSEEPGRMIYQKCFEEIAQKHRTCCFQSLGDSRSRAIAGLKDVFAAHPAFQAPARFDSFEQIIEGKPHEITQFFLGHYETACLSKRGINLLRERVHDALKAHATDGKIRHVMRFMQMTIEKPGVARAVNTAAACGRLPQRGRGQCAYEGRQIKP